MKIRGFGVLFAGAWLAAAGGARGQQFVFADSMFFESAWTHSIAWSVPTATLGPMTRPVSGGNPGFYQRGRHVTQGPFATIYDVHIATGSSYDPSVHGDVVSIDVQFDYIDFLPGGTQNGLAVRQDGRTYIRFVDSAGPHASWTTLSVAGILPNDPQWMEVAASGVTPGAPDFSSAGAPIQVGYYTFNWSLPTGFLIEREWGIDNFRVTLHAPDYCYPDLNRDGVLTVADFGAFRTFYVIGSAQGDCNASGDLTVGDFACFQTKFVLGCP